MSSPLHLTLSPKTAGSSCDGFAAGPSSRPLGTEDSCSLVPKLVDPPRMFVNNHGNRRFESRHHCEVCLTQKVCGGFPFNGFHGYQELVGQYLGQKRQSSYSPHFRPRRYFFSLGSMATQEEQSVSDSRFAENIRRRHNQDCRMQSERERQDVVRWRSNRRRPTRDRCKKQRQEVVTSAELRAALPWQGRQRALIDRHLSRPPQRQLSSGSRCKQLSELQ